MRTRDIILLGIGTIAILVFIGIMFDYYLKTQETQIIKKNVYYDSLLLDEQILLKKKDSLIQLEGNQIKNKLGNHEYRLKKIEKVIENMEKK
jgi:hypothetical protein